MFITFLGGLGEIIYFCFMKSSVYEKSLAEIMDEVMHKKEQFHLSQIETKQREVKIKQEEIKVHEKGLEEIRAARNGNSNSIIDENKSNEPMVATMVSADLKNFCIETIKKNKKLMKSIEVHEAYKLEFDKEGKDKDIASLISLELAELAWFNDFKKAKIDNTVYYGLPHFFDTNDQPKTGYLG